MIIGPNQSTNSDERCTFFLVKQRIIKAYLDGSGESHFLIEKFVKHVRCHRNIFDMEKTKLGSLEKKQIVDKLYEILRVGKREVENEVKILKTEKESIEKQKESRKIKIEEKKKKKKNDISPKIS